ncbi:MAG: RNA polymerase sigma factor [Deltaproteobacteria bacterium]|nr:RNA polymerase sigma factor [Deltaproteobacteria bacterium]
MKKAPLKNIIVEFLAAERKALVGYVRRLIDDAAERDSEDIVQDVILGLFNRADITIPIENIAAYVYQALRNRVIDYLRKRRDTVSIDEGWQEDEGSPLLRMLPELRIDSSDEISIMEARETLFQALSLLNDEEREIIIAVELEGRTFQELSEESGTPLGTLLARKSRAIHKIKESFLKDNLGG